MCPLANVFAAISRLLRNAALGCLLATQILFDVATAAGATVEFWLSNSLSGPTATSLEVPAGAFSTIDVWVRPPSNTTLNGFSLNLVAEQSVGAIEFSEVIVHNPQHGSGVYRHQIVFDSTATLVGTTKYDDLYLSAELVEKFFALTFFNESDIELNGEGIGPACQETLHCFMISGSPVWRIATVTFEAGLAGHSGELYLEIGEHGLLLGGEDPSETDAEFGADDVVNTWVPGSSPAHSGLADAVITVVASDADFDDDGDVDGRDFLIWQRGSGVGTLHTDGDADGDGIVDGADLAIWQAQYGAAAVLPVIAFVPEPTSSVVLGLLFLRLISRELSRIPRFRGPC